MAVCLLNSLICIVFRFHYDIIVRILYVRSFVSHVVSFLFTAFWVTWRFKYQKHCVKSVLIWSYSGLHFPAFGLNMERYSDTHSEWGIIRTRKTLNTDTFYAVKFDKKPNKLSWPLKNIHETLAQNIRSNLRFIQTSTEWKVSKYGIFPGPYFPAFGLILPLRIQSECGKMRIRKKSSFGHFSRIEVCVLLHVISNKPINKLSNQILKC